MYCKLRNGRSYCDRLVTVNDCHPYWLCIWIFNFECYIASEEPVYTLSVYCKVRKSDYVTLGPVTVNVGCFCGFCN
jgi:hypothetical protein